MTINEFKNEIKNKKVAVLGMGISNTPLIKFLFKLGAVITVFDKNEKEKLEDVEANYVFGEDYLTKLVGFDYIFRSPGIRFDLPEIAKEVENGAILTSEMETFLSLCPCEVFGITGSDGKTTTSTLVSEILKTHGYKVYLGGNIGTPLLDKVEEMTKDDKVVVELSSFQLQTFKKSVTKAIITNLSPNHLDIHKDMDEYVEAKKNIYKYGSELLVLNRDNSITYGFSDYKNTRLFSRKEILDKGVYVDNDKIIYNDGNKKEEILNINDIVIPGVHNVENYLAAIAVTIDEVEKDDIIKVATTFKGVEHRIELVRELNGVKYYNDSIASSPTRTIAGLNSFKDKVILIAGGYDKNLDYAPLAPVIEEHVKKLILVGATSEKIKKALGDTKIPIYEFNDFKEAVDKSKEISEKGDIVILSPASASFDLFKNFADRGNTFKEIVNSYKEE